jgi:hypothetical protein
MNLSALHAKLDELLRVCRKTASEMNDLLRLIRRHPEEPETSHSDDNPYGDGVTPRVSLAGYTANDADKNKSDKTRRFWQHFPIADRIQAVIGILLCLTLYIAIKNYQVSRETSIKQLRAFVYAKEVTIAGGGGNTIYLVKADIQNSGSTPARNTTIRNLGVYMIPRTPMVFSLPGGPNKADGILGLIPPGQFSTISFDIGNSDIAEGGATGGHNMLLFGDIHYFDVFGAEHVTKFCQSSKLIVKDDATSPEHWIFGACGIHNGDDESCPAEE